MIDHFANTLALRAHAFGTTIATTGTMTLEASATQYIRGSGSFLTDGFAVGMEVTPVGFPQTSVGRITAVTALTMTINGGRTVATSAGSRSLTAYLPAMRGYENVSITPVADTPYVTEEYLPGGGTTLTVGANSATLEALPIYVLTLFAPQNTGLGALRRSLDALLERFAPGTPLTVGSDVLRVRSDVIPSATAIRQLESGWAFSQLSISLSLFTANSR